VKPQPIVSRRLAELEAKIDAVEAPNPSLRGDRLDDALFQEWTNSVLSLLQRVFGERSSHFTNFKDLYVREHGSQFWFNQLKGVFRSAKSDYEGGYLFNLESLVSAEVAEDILEQSSLLLKSKYKDAACVLAGAALETALGRLCVNSGLPKAKMDRMNADLAKQGIYNVGMQKQITAWADRRNNAAHANFGAYTAADVESMIEGVRRFIGEHL